MITVKKMKAQMIYQDKRWRLLRAEKLRVNPICEECDKNGRVTTAEEVHHIQTIEDRPDLAFEETNLMSLCLECHDKIHQR